jgi:hypothetical protein
VPVHVTRLDDRTLVVRPEGGFLAFPFDNVFRSSAHPLRLGQRVELTNVSVEVTALTESGRPAEAMFRFSAPLEDGTFKWLQWKEGKYTLFDPPAIGTGILLPAQPLF